MNGTRIGSLGAIDLVAGGTPISNVKLNPNASLAYPLEIVNSTILKVRSHSDRRNVSGSIHLSDRSIL